MSEVYTVDEMRDRYGPFFFSKEMLSLNRSCVPSELWPLLPYAAFWGIDDDLAREALVQRAPKEVKKNLKEVLHLMETPLLKWLAGEESYDENPSPEYCAFSTLLMAADSILPSDLE